MSTTTHARLAKRLGLTAALATGLVALAAGSASAATFPNAPNSNTFQSSAGGWTSTVTHDGLCLVPGVTCASGSAQFIRSGGVDGASDGYLRSRVDTVAGVLSNTRVKWFSPAFTLDSHPTAATAHVSLRGAIGALVNIGGHAELSYHVRDLTTSKEAAVAIPDDQLSPSSGFQNISADLASTKRLKAGHSYQITVAVHMTTPIASVPVTGKIDYDNISLDTTP